MSLPGSQPSGDQPPPAVELTTPPPAEGQQSTGSSPRTDQPLLEHVLRQTISALGENGSISPELMQAMSAIGRQFGNREFTLEPAGVELIDAVLLSILPPAPAALSAEKRRQMALEIAETLFDDPHTRARLTTLWKRLLEAQR